MWSFAKNHVRRENDLTWYGHAQEALLLTRMSTNKTLAASSNVDIEDPAGTYKALVSMISNEWFAYIHK